MMPRQIHLVAAVLFSVWWIGPTDNLPAIAASQVPVSTLRATELLHSLYPELLDKPLSAHAEIVSSSFLLHVAETGRPDPRHPVVRLAIPLLSARLTLNQESQVVRYAAEGPFVQSDKVAAVDQTIRAHPEWSETERARALDTAGAQYGPARQIELETRVRPREWEKHVGHNAGIQFLGFAWQDPDAAGLEPRPMIGWLARLDTSGTDGRAIQYHVRIEPFQGRVTAIARVGGVGDRGSH